MFGLTRAIAGDHAAEGIRAVAIFPRTVESEWITKSSRTIPIRFRLVARCLSTSSMAFINRSELVMDGGITPR